MGTIKVTSSNLYNILINDVTSNDYTSSPTDLDITVTYENPDISGTLANETNFPASGEPSLTIPAKLTVKIKKSEMDPEQYLGFRLSADSADANFKFKTTNTQFAVTENTIPITSDTENIIWANVKTASLDTDTTETEYILIPIEIVYSGSTANDNLTFSVDVYENTTASATDMTQLDVNNNIKSLEVTAYTASLTSSMSSSDVTSIRVLKDSFRRNDAIAVSTDFTETVTDGYKKISKVELTENLTTSITATDIYITTSSSLDTIDALITDAAKTKEEGSATVSFPLGSTIENVLNYNNGIITLTMVNTDTNFAKIFTATDTDGTTPVLPEKIYIYIKGTVTGLGGLSA